MAAMVMSGRQSSSSSASLAGPTVKCATCSRPLQLDELDTHVCPKPSSSSSSSAAAPSSSSTTLPAKANPGNARPVRSPSPMARSPSPLARTPSPLARTTSPGELHAPPSPGRSGSPRAKSPLSATSGPPPARPQRAASPTPSSRGSPPVNRMMGNSPNPNAAPHPPPLRRAATDLPHAHSPSSMNSPLHSPHHHHPGPSSSPHSNPSPQHHLNPNESLPIPHSPARSMTVPARNRSDSASTQHTFANASHFDAQRGSITVSIGGRESVVPLPSIHIPDTESGGSAGRAGVGRRAFAAVAQAAFLATSYGHGGGDEFGQPPMSPAGTMFSGMGHQHQPSFGSYLDPNGGRGTPALSIPRSSPSPRIPEVRTPSPGINFDPRVASIGGGSPFEPSGPLSPASSMTSGRSRSPLVPDTFDDHGFNLSPTKGLSPSPNSPTSSVLRARSDTLDSDTELGYMGADDDDPYLPPPSASSSTTLVHGDSLNVRPGIRRAGTAPDSFERIRGSTMDDTAADARMRMQERKDTAPLHLRPRGDSSASTRPLALRRPSTSAEMDVIRPSSPSSMLDPISFPSTAEDLEDGDSLTRRLRMDRMSIASSTSSYTAPTLPPDEENNRLSTLTDGTVRLSRGLSRNRSIVRKPSKSTGSRPQGLNIPMETLEEEIPELPPIPSSASAATSSLAIPSSRQRTKSGPSSTSSSSGRRRKRTVKTCVKCGKKIEDGRWIPVDETSSVVSPATLMATQHLTVKSNASSASSSSSSSGEVLCEQDWKEMYLPKCRRCGLTIESHAVSSADGQLKGKYHPACFNCSTCQKPFPNKEFYVLAGQPYCDYHYHAANNSLCAAPTCRKPIEGNCAEDHDGRRYHPDHLVCAKDGCGTRLEEYFCDDAGRMFCEKHANFVRSEDGGSFKSALYSPGGDDVLELPSPGSPNPTSPSSKRRTRFLDLDQMKRDSLSSLQ